MPERSSRIEGALYGALVADAFALGADLIYDIDEIKENFPVYDRFYDPISECHSGKKAGDFTHYGDQSLWLLESISLEKEFSLASFSSRWKEYMSAYKGYIDGASKIALENLDKGKLALESGSSSQEIGAVGRMAPLALLYYDQRKSFEDAAILQTNMTHNSPLIIETVRFFSSLLFCLFNGASPRECVKKMLNEIKDAKLHKWVKVALVSTEHESAEAINSFGQSGRVGSAFPAALHLILKYENDYMEAMKQNVYAGGDSAARGILVGMVLGAYRGIESIPAKLIDDLSSKERIYLYLQGVRNE